jgi:treble-clef zinc-finger protein
MHELSSEGELLACFREIDRPEVELAPDLAFPLRLDRRTGAFAWAVGPRAYLLFRDAPDRPTRGIVFHRDTGGLPDVVAMCEWCHRVRGHARVKLMSARAGSRRSVGLYLCSDLSCIATAQELPGVDDVPEGLDTDERTRRTIQRIADFATRRLF